MALPPINTDIYHWWRSVHRASWYRPSPLAKMLKEDHEMTDLNKALNKTITKMIKERVHIEKSELKELVKQTVAMEVHRIADTITESMRTAVEDIVRNKLEDGLMHAVLANTKTFVQAAVAKALDKRLANSDIALIPKPDPCPRIKAGTAWSLLEDLELREEIGTTMNTLAQYHGRTSLAIFCRLRDKVFTKQDL